VTNTHRSRDEPISNEWSAQFQNRYEDIKWSVTLYLRREFGGIDVDEIADDVMEQVFRRWNDLDEPKAWALKAARNKALNAKRRTEIRLSDVAGHEDMWVSKDGVTDSHDDVQEILQAIYQLPEGYRTVVWLAHLGYTTKEIMAETKWSYRTVSRYKCDGKKALEAILQQRRRSS
jgi:RNA polymerase sigma factor (sigma-70 family)